MALSSSVGTREGAPWLPGKSALRNGLFELSQPYVRAAVGGRAPVAAWRQRTARRDLRAVGQRRAFELVGKEATQEEPEPMADFLQLERAHARCRNIGGPRALLHVVPGVPGQERDLRRAIAEA